MSRRPLSLWILSLAGIVLAVWLTVQGLHIRLFGEFLPQRSAPTLWYADPEEAHIIALRFEVRPAVVAWPLLVLGLAWCGALSALWMGLDWGRHAITLLLLGSLLAPWLGTALALIGLLSRSSPSMRAWLKAS